MFRVPTAESLGLWVSAPWQWGSGRFRKGWLGLWRQLIPLKNLEKSLQNVPLLSQVCCEFHAPPKVAWTPHSWVLNSVHDPSSKSEKGVVSFILPLWSTLILVKQWGRPRVHLGESRQHNPPAIIDFAIPLPTKRDNLNPAIPASFTNRKGGGAHRAPKWGGPSNLSVGGYFETDISLGHKGVMCVIMPLNLHDMSSLPVQLCGQ